MVGTYPSPEDVIRERREKRLMNWKRGAGSKEIRNLPLQSRVATYHPL